MRFPAGSRLRPPDVGGSRGEFTRSLIATLGGPTGRWSVPWREPAGRRLGRSGGNVDGPRDKGAGRCERGPRGGGGSRRPLNGVQIPLSALLRSARNDGVGGAGGRRALRGVLFERGTGGRRAGRCERGPRGGGGSRRPLYGVQIPLSALLRSARNDSVGGAGGREARRWVHFEGGEGDPPPSILPPPGRPD